MTEVKTPIPGDAVGPAPGGGGARYVSDSEVHVARNEAWDALPLETKYQRVCEALEDLFEFRASPQPNPESPTDDARRFLEAERKARIYIDIERQEGRALEGRVTKSL